MRAVAILLLLIAGYWISANPPIQGLAYNTGGSGEQMLLKDILTEIKGMRLDLRAIAGGNGARLPATSHEAVIKVRCAKCHTEGVAADEGGEFVMVDGNGKVVEFSATERRHIRKKVKENAMPPGGGLSEEEKRVLDNLPVKGKGS